TDTGFYPALPYKPGADANADKEDGESGRVLVGMPETVGGDDARGLLIPLAGVLLLFVFAMHALYASRRAAVAAKVLETAEEPVSPSKVRPASPASGRPRRRHRLPPGPGGERAAREVDGHGFQHLAAADAASLVGVGRGGHLDRAEVQRRPADRPGPLLAGDRDVDVVAGLGVLVDLARGQQGVGVV